MKFISITLVTIFSSPLWAQSFEPGIWNSKEVLVLNGMPLPESSDEDCRTESQTKDAKASIEKELKRHGCSLTKWTVKNQMLDAGIKCKNENMEGTGNLKGEFSRKSYDLKGEAKGFFREVLPATIGLKLTGKWIKDCTAQKK